MPLSSTPRSSLTPINKRDSSEEKSNRETSEIVMNKSIYFVEISETRRFHNNSSSEEGTAETDTSHDGSVSSFNCDPGIASNTFTRRKDSETTTANPIQNRITDDSLSPASTNTANSPPHSNVEQDSVEEENTKSTLYLYDLSEKDCSSEHFALPARTRDQNKEIPIKSWIQEAMAKYPKDRNPELLGRFAYSCGMDMTNPENLVEFAKGMEIIKCDGGYKIKDLLAFARATAEAKAKSDKENANSTTEANGNGITKLHSLGKFATLAALSYPEDQTSLDEIIKFAQAIPVKTADDFAEFASGVILSFDKSKHVQFLARLAIKFKNDQNFFIKLFNTTYTDDIANFKKVKNLDAKDIEEIKKYAKDIEQINNIDKYLKYVENFGEFAFHLGIRGFNNLITFANLNKIPTNKMGIFALGANVNNGADFRTFASKVGIDDCEKFAKFIYDAGITDPSKLKNLLNQAGIRDPNRLRRIAAVANITDQSQLSIFLKYSETTVTLE